MRWLRAREGNRVVEEGETLDALLASLAKYGEPLVVLHKGPDVGGWRAELKMEDRDSGARMRVESGFGFRSPADAVRECLARVRRLVASAGGGS